VNSVRTRLLSLSEPVAGTFAAYRKKQ